MYAIQSLVQDVEKTIARRDLVSRATMLSRLTRLFGESAEGLAEPQVAAFDEVIFRLAQDVEVAVRAELADAMADIPNAPRNVVRDLAFDLAVEVAVPVLLRSPRIDEGDLVRIALERGQDHLYALSQRKSLTERVTDVLVTRGDRIVARAVAGNDGARFSDKGFEQLADRARADGDLYVTLNGRSALSQFQIAKLVVLARERASERLSLEADPDAARRAAEAAAGTIPLQARDVLSRALEVVNHKACQGSGLGVDEQDIVAWLNEGRAPEALVALARIAGVPPEMALKAHHAAHYDPMLLLVRSVRFGWGVFKLFLQAKPGEKPSTETMRSAFEAFQGLSIATAQRVVRFTALREYSPGV